ncbi:MAG TPA: glycerol-3-phosphate dehydrogenase/oxidase [Gaiellaceae bacterium]|nr:glycerol-3-phosphate dehydrogenase/oxidase [Gaiellaceae bacterium]
MSRQLRPDRARALEELASRDFDLLVVGGGIIGAGIAAAAARHGIAVALVERGDFGGATSSSSSKLVHGGLRYLRLGDVGLVREAHEERRHLMTRVAPHLVRPLPFLLPLYDSGPYRPAVVQAGIALYSTLARARLNGLVPPERARRLVPDLRPAGLRRCGLYVDCVTNDSRLTLANVRAAAESGATVVNGAAVSALRLAGGRVTGADVVVDGETLAVSARTVVNAAGPWVDEVRRLADAGVEPSIRLSKGVHVLLSADTAWSAALTIPHDKVRVSFAVPWEGMLLLGTTDTLHEGRPDTVVAEPADVDRVLEEAAVALEEPAVRRDQIRAVFAGLRVLPQSGRETARARRETVYIRDGNGLLTVAGGKLTTYRRIALDALERLRPDLGLHRIDRQPWPLPGAEGLDRVGFPAEIGPTLRAHLIGLYGSLAPEVLEPALADPTLLEPLTPGAPDIAAQALYAVEREWARNPEDILRRRTTLALRGLAGAELTRRVAGLIGRHGKPLLGSHRS